jgi:hypothetical protein
MEQPFRRSNTNVLYPLKKKRASHFCKGAGAKQAVKQIRKQSILKGKPFSDPAGSHKLMQTLKNVIYFTYIASV